RRWPAPPATSEGTSASLRHAGWFVPPRPAVFAQVLRWHARAATGWHRGVRAEAAARPRVPIVPLPVAWGFAGPPRRPSDTADNALACRQLFREALGWPDSPDIARERAWSSLRQVEMRNEVANSLTSVEIYVNRLAARKVKRAPTAPTRLLPL